MTISELNKNRSFVQELNELFDENNYTGKITKEGGTPALLRYLKTPQPFAITSISAIWSFPGVNFNGKLGKHLCIRLPGDRVCELEKIKDRTWKSLKKRVMDTEDRQATGKQIEKMWRLHRDLIPKYREWGTLHSAPEGLINYRFFTNDYALLMSIAF